MKTISLKVGQFNNYVKNILDAEDFLSNISIYGEVTNFKISGNNAYFDLKDDTAMLSCVKFGAADISFNNGDLITVYGKVNFYVKSGRLNFIVSKAEAYGLGELYKKFLELKAKLEAQGYFIESIKKQIPRYSKRIGVVTSETGAVIRDIIHVTKSKNPYTDIIVYPSKVQGASAEDDIICGINYFNSRDDIDVIIIARGGGSMEDLAPFNTEKIVLGIYASRLPIISAVGHETDFTLCDFASDLRVPTPSVAAEVAVFDYYNEIRNIELILNNNYYLITKLLQESKKETSYVLDSLMGKLKLKLEQGSSKVTELTSSISLLVKLKFDSLVSKTNLLLGVLSKQNPLEILKNGYAVVQKDNKRIVSATHLAQGDKIEINLSNGKVDARVEKINLD